MTRSQPSAPLFEPVIISLIGADPLERPGPGKRGPIAGLYHRASRPTGKLVIYVPGGIAGAPLSGRHDYNALAAGLDTIDHSLLAMQMETAQKPLSIRLDTCIEDIRTVLAWAKQQGFTSVSLAGNGLGAARIALWAAREPDDLVTSIILLSAMESPYLALQRSGSAQQKEERDGLLRDCRDRIAGGHKLDAIDVALPGGRRALTAELVIDYLGGPEEASSSLIELTGQLRFETCLIHGDKDAIAPPEGALAIYEGLSIARRRKLVWIADGDHHLLMPNAATTTGPSTVTRTVEALCDWLASAKDQDAPAFKAVAAPQRAALFEFHCLPLTEPDPVETPRDTLPPIPVLLHRATKPTQKIVIYIQAGITGQVLTGRHDCRPLALALDEQDCSLLVVQSSAARRTEYVKFDTAVNDIATAMAWAKAQGFSEIVLIGVSMGNPRVAFWNSIMPDPAVKGMVFLAVVDSVYLGTARIMTPAQREHRDRLLQECRELIAAGQGDKLIVGELGGRPFPMAAEVYLSYFGELQDMNASALKFADKITVPVLLMHGTQDIGCPSAGAQDVHDALAAAPEKELIFLEGADHQLMAPGWSLDVVTRKISEFVAKHLR